jgi:hypothetical protein
LPDIDAVFADAMNLGKVHIGDHPLDPLEGETLAERRARGFPRCRTRRGSFP